MNKRNLGLLEMLVHLPVIIAIGSFAHKSYDLVDAFVAGTKKVGFLITTNTDHLFWHVLVYGLYTISWLLFYYGCFKRYEDNLKQKIIAGLVGWIVISGLHMLILYVVSSAIYPDRAQAGMVLEFDPLPPVSSSLFTFYLGMGFVAFLAQTTMQFLDRYRQLEQADRVETELALIRSQLRPHFFFNTLNNLYAMALETEHQKLADGIQNLTGMMRYALRQSTQHWVSLTDEWEYLRKYVALQQLRFEKDELPIRIELTGDPSGVRIAPMILINFVENACKHGLSYERASFVDIRLSVTGTNIVLKVENSNHPSAQDKGRSGIGTAQTRKLLLLHYQDTYRLDVSATPELYQIELSLPIR